MIFLKNENIIIIMVHDIIRIARGIIVSKDEFLKILNVNIITDNRIGNDFNWLSAIYDYSYTMKTSFKFHEYSKTYKEKYIILGFSELFMDSLPYQYGSGLMKSFINYFPDKNTSDITENDINDFLMNNNSEKKRNLEIQKYFDKWSIHDQELLLFAKKHGFTNTNIECITPFD